MEYSIERFETVTDAADFAQKHVAPEKFIKACENCPNFGQYWSCPPYDFPVTDIWARHSTLTVTVSRIAFRGERSFEDMLRVLESVKDGMDKEMAEREKKTPGSLALYAGRCRICEKCARPDGKPCRNPDKMRYSIESLGGDVIGTVKDLFGIETEWNSDGKLPEHLILAAGLLE